MNKKILTALAAATITSLAISAPFVGAKKTVNKPASLIALQEEIQANHDRYAASAKALEAGASVPGPDYIQNGTPAPGLVTTTDYKTATSASIIMGQQPMQTDKEGAISPEAQEAAKTGYYQGRKVLSVQGNVIVLEGDNQSTSPARYASAEEAALPTASRVAIPQSTPANQAGPSAQRVTAISVNPNYDTDLKAIIQDPKNANNKPMNSATYAAAMANASK
ncbi:MAG: hypothetical protein HXP25_00310 [Veillonella sp.]|nr:hypothetical protein [Veillonella sp.]